MGNYHEASEIVAYFNGERIGALSSIMIDSGHGWKTKGKHASSGTLRINEPSSNREARKWLEGEEK